MGGLPKKALRKGQLVFKTAGSVVADGSHQTYKVSFIENGKKYEGFYKELQKDYPALLAKMSVATSLFKRIFQGERSAEERLVFDDQDRLLGTLSINVDGFRPFNFASETVPADANTRETVIPSTKTLLERNFIEILLGRWFLDDDDGHPHNMSLAGDIDFDMFWYWFTIHMKGARAVIGEPKTRVNLTTDDWERFPNVKDSKPYHWPSYQHPGQETIPSVLPSVIQKPILNRALPKIYADPKQFEDLARSPIAQEQKFAAALKVLLTFEPEMVRRRLEELFDDVSLNYTSLDEISVDLRILYEKTFPQFCNEESNKKPFVDFIMDMYQEHFDNLYRVVVFYMGCDNNGFGVPLPATCNNLFRKPSCYKNIVEWVKLQNETRNKNDDPSLKYDLEGLQKRYHQVWRDTFAPHLKELLHSTYKLTTKIVAHVSSETDEKKLIGKEATDATLTKAWELFGTLPVLSKEKISPLIKVDQDSGYRKALFLLIEFTNKFNAITKAYYEKERVDLTEDDNLQFCKSLNALLEEYDLSIRGSLAFHTSYAKEFNRIAQSLEEFKKQVNFQRHLTTTDEQMMDSPTAISAKEIAPYTSDEVMRKYNKELFLWARGLRPEQFNQYLIDIIDKQYVPALTLLSTRHREAPVKEYLRTSGDSCDIKLAYIFSSGETGALNKLLVQHLTPIMLQSQNLPSVRQAVKEGTFNTKESIEHYTKSVVAFANSDPKLIHLYHPAGIKLFYNALYDWIDKLPAQDFRRIIEISLREYESGLWLKSGSRRKEINGYRFHSQAKILAFIFLRGEDTSTLSRVLFQKVVEAMKTDITKAPQEVQEHPGNRLVRQFNMIENKDFYTNVLKINAQEPSNKQEPVVEAISGSFCM